MSPFQNANDEDISQEEVDFLANLDDQIATGQAHLEKSSVSGDSIDQLGWVRSALQELWHKEPVVSHVNDLTQFSLVPHAKFSFGRFQNLELIGIGGFGMVYRAYDPNLHRMVALKIAYRNPSYLPNMAGNVFKEAQAIAQFDHPNIVPVYDAGEVNGACFLTLGLCTGPSLAQFLATNTPIPLATVVAIVKDIAAGLACSHNRGILHRDVKPANILLFPKTNAAPEEFPFTARLSDFGLSKIAEVSFQQSKSSIIVGTPAYIPPEQACGLTKAIGPQADIYSLGVILYELLTKTLPFAILSFSSVLERSAKTQPVPPKQIRTEIDSNLDSICLKCLQREPARRYANGQELVDDLDRYAQGKSIAGKLPTRLEHIADWLRQPERIPEAGTYSLMLNAMMSLWVIANLWIAYPILYYNEILLTIFTTLALLFLVHLPLCLLGCQVRQNQSKAIFAGFLLSFLPLFMSLATLAGMPGPFADDYHSNPRLGIPLHHKQILFGLIGFLCLCQTAYYAVAIAAYLRSRTRR